MPKKTTFQQQATRTQIYTNIIAGLSPSCSMKLDLVCTIALLLGQIHPLAHLLPFHPLHIALYPRLAYPALGLIALECLLTSIGKILAFPPMCWLLTLLQGALWLSRRGASSASVGTSSDWANSVSSAKKLFMPNDYLMAARE